MIVDADDIYDTSPQNFLTWNYVIDSRLRRLTIDYSLTQVIEVSIDTKTEAQQLLALGTHRLRIALRTTFDDDSKYISQESDAFALTIICNTADNIYPYTS